MGKFTGQPTSPGYEYIPDPTKPTNLTDKERDKLVTERLEAIRKITKAIVTGSTGYYIPDIETKHTATGK